MVNTMGDLRQEVASRLRNTLDGKEIDMMENVTPRLPHMIGVTPLGKVHDPNNEEMTLMDTQHQFWEEYEEDIRTKNQVTEKLETAVRSLREDDIFTITHPYGEEAEIIYCEVDKESADNNMQTSCKECGAPVTAQPNLTEDTGHYYLTFSIDCSKCDFSGLYQQNLQRR